MKDKIQKESNNFPVVVTKKNDGYYMTLLNFRENGISDFTTIYSENFEDAAFLIRKVLSLTLIDLIHSDKEIPQASSMTNIELKENQFIYYVAIDPVYEAAKLRDKVVNKRINIPAWIESEARKLNINFSKILQNGLKNEVGIK